MKARELRIGNLVTLDEKVRRELWDNQIHAQNKYFEVKTIYSDGDVALELDDEIVDISENEISGIPLSEQWLLDLGAELISENRFDFEAYNYGYFDLTENGLTVTFQSQPVCEPIKYVHQFQNIFHALTGAELTTTKQK